MSERLLDAAAEAARSEADAARVASSAEIAADAAESALQAANAVGSLASVAAAETIASYSGRLQVVEGALSECQTMLTETRAEVVTLRTLAELQSIQLLDLSSSIRPPEETPAVVPEVIPVPVEIVEPLVPEDAPEVPVPEAPRHRIKRL